MSKIHIGSHALQRLAFDRDLVDVDDVQNAVDKFENNILHAKFWEVRVVVKRFRVNVTSNDGYTGNLVVAAVDPCTRTVKTILVMTDKQARYLTIKKHQPHFGL